MAYSRQGDINAAPYLVGDRVYGGGRPFPNIGPSDPMGYRERDLRHKARRDAVLRRMKANNSKNYMSADAQRSV
jgi:hypothetical protein